MSCSRQVFITCVTFWSFDVGFSYHCICSVTDANYTNTRLFYIEKKLYNKKYDDKNLKLFTDKFNSYYVIGNGHAFLAVKDKTIPYGVRFILLGDESYLKPGEKVRFVRKIKKK